VIEGVRGVWGYDGQTGIVFRCYIFIFLGHEYFDLFGVIRCGFRCDVPTLGASYRLQKP